jgi:hypothetical protein
MTGHMARLRKLERSIMAPSSHAVVVLAAGAGFIGDRRLEPGELASLRARGGRVFVRCGDGPFPDEVTPENPSVFLPDNGRGDGPISDKARAAASIGQPPSPSAPGPH